MTHTNHRQGGIESLIGDWVVMMIGTPKINDKDCRSKLKKFLQLSLKYDPVNAGTARTGTVLTIGWQRFTDEVEKAGEAGAAHTLVFDSVDKVANFLKDLVRADLGLSVVYQWASYGDRPNMS